MWFGMISGKTDLDVDLGVTSDWFWVFLMWNEGQMSPTWSRRRSSWWTCWKANRPSSGVISLKELGLNMWALQCVKFWWQRIVSNDAVFPTVQDFYRGRFVFGTAGAWQHAAIPGEPCAGELQGMCRWQVERWSLQDHVCRRILETHPFHVKLFVLECIVVLEC